MGTTTDPNDPRLGRGADKEPGPQHDTYLVLSSDERAKGFVRPVRRTYQHVGNRLRGTLEMLDAPETHGGKDYIAIDRFYIGEGESKKRAGTFLTAQDVAEIKRFGNRGGCRTNTTMSHTIAETYARNPGFYGSTYCCHCNMHLPVGEFIWIDDGSRVGS